MLWRPVRCNPPRASYQEVCTFWTLDDLLVFCEMMDIQEDLEAEAHEIAKSKYNNN